MSRKAQLLAKKGDLDNPKPNTAFVSTNGSDSGGDGSQYNPFATIYGVYNNMPTAERIVLEDGFYTWDGNYTVDHSSYSTRDLSVTPFFGSIDYIAKNPGNVTINWIGATSTRTNNYYLTKNPQNGDTVRHFGLIFEPTGDNGGYDALSSDNGEDDLASIQGYIEYINCLFRKDTNSNQIPLIAYLNATAYNYNAYRTVFDYCHFDYNEVDIYSNGTDNELGQTGSTALSGGFVDGWANIPPGYNNMNTITLDPSAGNEGYNSGTYAWSNQAAYDNLWKE